jgi:hypothetical protein
MRLGGFLAVATVSGGVTALGWAEEVEVRGSGPEPVLDAYRRATEQRIGDPDQAIYSERSRQFMARRGGTERRMANSARSLNRCSLDERAEQGDRAVIYGPVSERRCPPYCFVHEDGRWRLDLATMARSIRMNQKNQWRLTMGESSPYWLTFDDWELSDNGFPLSH